jgi:hypothetical protein
MRTFKSYFLFTVVNCVMHLTNLSAAYFVAPGSTGDTLHLRVLNSSSLLPLLDVNVTVVDTPDFVINMTPDSTSTVPPNISPEGVAVATFTFDVDSNTVMGTRGTIVFDITNSSGDTTTKEIDLIVGTITYFTSVPYYEDFEADNGFYIGTGAWEWGIPTSGPGSACSGTKVWATNIDGNYPNDAQDFLHTIFVDLTGTIAPRLSFYHYYNMEYGWDGGIVQVSTDDGLTFQTIEPKEGYSAFVGETPAFTGLSTPDSTYKMETFYLAPFVGDTIMIRFQFASDGSITKPGWYIDDVAVAESPSADVAAISIVEPSILTNIPPLDVKAQIVNFGSATQTFNVRLEVDTLGGMGGSVFSNVKQITSLAPTDTILLAFDTWAPPQVGYYDLRAMTQLPLDADPSNDTVFVQTFIIGIVTLPHFEDFEASDGGFFATGSWEWGIPTSGPDTAYSGTKLWATELDTNYSNDAQDFLYLPAVDLSGLALTPIFSFYHYYDMEEGYDGGVVQISTDRGLSFTTLTPIGGYPGAINLGEDSAYTGLSTPDSSYVEASFDLSSYVGDTVILRLQFVSDFSVTSPGWYVDDVNIATVFIRGDANGDGTINVSDVVYLINYLFIGGPAPVPLAAGDVNCDGIVNVSDVVYLINYLFIGGPPPGCE